MIAPCTAQGRRCLIPKAAVLQEDTPRSHHFPCRGSGSSAAWSNLTKSICLPYTSSPLSLHWRRPAETDTAPVCKHKRTVGALALGSIFTVVVSIKIDVDFCLAEGKKEGHKPIHTTIMRNIKFS